MRLNLNLSRSGTSSIFSTLLRRYNVLSFETVKWPAAAHSSIFHSLQEEAARSRAQHWAFGEPTCPFPSSRRTLTCRTAQWSSHSPERCTPKLSLWDETFAAYWVGACCWQRASYPPQLCQAGSDCSRLVKGFLNKQKFSRAVWEEVNGPDHLKQEKNVEIVSFLVLHLGWTFFESDEILNSLPRTWCRRVFSKHEQASSRRVAQLHPGSDPGPVNCFFWPSPQGDLLVTPCASTGPPRTCGAADRSISI